MNALCTLLLVFPWHSSGVVWTVYASIAPPGEVPLAVDDDWVCWVSGLR